MAELSGVRVLVIATDGFEEVELTEPVKALKDARATVVVAAPGKSHIQGFKGDLEKTNQVKVDQTLGDVDPEEFDAVHLPGGTVNADRLRTLPEVQAILRTMQDAGKPIAAICHGSWSLVSAGLVGGRTLTSYHTIKDDIINAGGEWQDSEVVEDGNWVTSREPKDIPAYNLAIIKLFARAHAESKS